MTHSHEHSVNHVDQVEAILRAQSMSSVVVLACKSRRLTIHLAVVTWLAIFLVSALISYS